MQKHEVVMIKAPMLKRIGAYIIDFFVFVCFMFLISVIVGPIINSFQDVKRCKQEYYNIVIESGIYQGTNFDNLAFISEDYDEKITLFYEKYDDVKNYTDLKANEYKKYFEFDEATNTYIPTKDEKEMAIVYVAILNNQCTKILSKNSAYVDYSIRITSYQTLELLISGVIGAIINYIALPLILKNGQTLGKKLLQLYVVSLNGDYHCTWVKLVFRSIVFILGEILLGVISFGLIPVLSLVLACTNKKAQSLHDFIVGTTVCDITLFPTENNTRRQIVVESFASLDQELYDGEVQVIEQENNEIEQNQEGSKDE